MNSIDSITKFFNVETIVIAGVSANEKKFSNYIYRELKSKGKKVIAVNPNASSICGDVCYPDLKSVPQKITSLLISTKKELSDKIVKDALGLNVGNIWLQQGCETSEAVKTAKDSGVNIIFNECILMFAEPVKSYHSFHKLLIKLFGKYPK